ncbi:hypothetical protein NW756_003328 [Fusarium oxysporum]|nr:hypothetical protein NW753_006295 [Fusarium oxysporum]KAJ4061875.1 hypothetical protein NW763_005272 [Fusarium oxysporum]KAJ4098730.1 hypothetical protein NW756_003328 [Fusarium oxysporum]
MGQQVSVIWNRIGSSVEVSYHPIHYIKGMIVHVIYPGRSFLDLISGHEGVLGGERYLEPPSACSLKDRGLAADDDLVNVDCLPFANEGEVGELATFARSVRGQQVLEGRGHEKYRTSAYGVCLQEESYSSRRKILL